ncbi:DNA-deoxyinosine glycosylase [Novosphingobium taihuense]|uniref:Hypoxanthine-DNA glycosylase n=1 Tax=Novosphingobium taihuense TaxID=260085 RepID=A0A7W7AFQ3_9SPHN|nr:DNA-deoxyinosine glycosylase [Novosphingobium taihuense]MBB4615207.1 hypoxanthine-DNA glycosylase [Novosphingobium taihuense]TWH84242.1 G/U mismatch-specific uracil-DNA glycosylase [Novosphingobium taihuense]
MTGRKSSFAPVVDERTRVLILGSLPGEASLVAARYYANPRNQFWRLLGAVIAEDLVAQPYDERLETLLAHRVGLWDSIGSATRRGSLDAAIREIAPNPLATLAASLPDLRCVAFNGAKSASVGAPQLAGAGAFERLRLPSSSPAHAALAFDAKLEEWTKLRKFLA